MRRVVFNKKGGVGKTSITCNLAAIAASLGRRVLVVDLDSQANSTHYLLGEAEPEESVADFLTQSGGFFTSKRPVTDYIVPTAFEGLSLLPASAKLQDVEHKLEQRYKIMDIKKALDGVASEFDEIYIDTPPALNFYTKSALISGDSVLIPFDCDAFSRQSLDTVAEAVGEIRDDHNPELGVGGIIVNNFQARAKLPQQLVAELEEAGYPMLETRLGNSVRMRESHQKASPLIYSAPKHPLTLQFEALYSEITGH